MSEIRDRPGTSEILKRGTVPRRFFLISGFSGTFLILFLLPGFLLWFEFTLYTEWRALLRKRISAIWHRQDQANQTELCEQGKTKGKKVHPSSSVQSQKYLFATLLTVRRYSRYISTALQDISGYITFPRSLVPLFFPQPHPATPFLFPTPAIAIHPQKIRSSIDPNSLNC